MRAKLLIVDDDQDVRSVAEDTLVDAGYSVLQAEGGPQALVLLDDHPSLRVMISDVRMPGMLPKRQFAAVPIFA